MTTGTCNHGNSAPVNVLNNLHDSPTVGGQHKCVVCAYEEGYEFGKTSAVLTFDHYAKCQAGLRAPSDMLSGLSASEAGAGRHKCPVCAYNLGFTDARAAI
jgi:hypothetical protein